MKKPVFNLDFGDWRSSKLFPPSLRLYRPEKVSSTLKIILTMNNSHWTGFTVLKWMHPYLLIALCMSLLNIAVTTVTKDRPWKIAGVLYGQLRREIGKTKQNNWKTKQKRETMRWPSRVVWADVRVLDYLYHATNHKKHYGWCFHHFEPHKNSCQPTFVVILLSDDTHGFFPFGIRFNIALTEVSRHCADRRCYQLTADPPNAALFSRQKRSQSFSIIWTSSSVCLHVTDRDGAL